MRFLKFFFFVLVFFFFSFSAFAHITKTENDIEKIKSTAEEFARNELTTKCIIVSGEGYQRGMSLLYWDGRYNPKNVLKIDGVIYLPKAGKHGRLCILEKYDVSLDIIEVDMSSYEDGKIANVFVRWKYKNLPFYAKVVATKGGRMFIYVANDEGRFYVEKYYLFSSGSAMLLLPKEKRKFQEMSRQAKEAEKKRKLELAKMESMSKVMDGRPIFYASEHVSFEDGGYFFNEVELFENGFKAVQERKESGSNHTHESSYNVWFGNLRSVSFKKLSKTNAVYIEYKPRKDYDFFDRASFYFSDEAKAKELEAKIRKAWDAWKNKYSAALFQ